MSDGDKPELNPYESPRAAEPLTREQVVKRAVGVGALILLTPPAMIVAVFCCCSATSWINGGLAGWIVFGGPFVVLAALMGTGIVLDRSRDSTPRSAASRFVLFIATPFVVAGATVAGFFFGALAYPVGWAMVATFFVPPAIALLFMLWLIWKTK